MDVLYLLRHSPNEDLEIRYSMRSIECHAPWIGKVWVFGDRPAFLTCDTSIAEHVPHEATAGVIGAKAPVENIFLLIYLGSLIVGLSQEFVRFSDDYILTAPYPRDMAEKVRYLKNLSDTRNWGPKRWQRQLRHSYELLRRKGHSGYNFEAHVPQYLRREWVADAYNEFQDDVHPGRYEGLIGNTEILNHARARHGLTLTHVATEGKRFGFWNRQPRPSEISMAARGKAFFNFDDRAWGDGIKAFLHARFPEKSRYEK